MTSFDHPDLGPVTISPMFEREFAMVMDHWQRSSHWRRSLILAAVEAGPVLVARDEGGLGLGWVALSGDALAHGYVKSGFRGNGLARALWDAAGRPSEHVDDATRRTKRVLQHLRGDST